MEQNENYQYRGRRFWRINGLASFAGMRFLVFPITDTGDDEADEERFEQLKGEFRSRELSFSELDGYRLDPETGAELHCRALLVYYPASAPDFRFGDFAAELIAVASDFGIETVLVADGKRVGSAEMDAVGQEGGSFLSTEIPGPLCCPPGGADEVVTSVVAGGPEPTGLVADFQFTGIRVPQNLMEAVDMELQGYAIQSGFQVEGQRFRFPGGQNKI
jgi:hypothetical protein